MGNPRLIALDWGTTSLRAYLFDAAGRIADRREAADGIQAIVDGRFREAFEALCAPWLASAPRIPAIASGMIGSRQGWREAAYLPTPAGFDEVAERLLTLDDAAGRRFRIVPGVSTLAANGTHDVIRGEETQVFGALSRLGATDLTVVLPGTHSKWVRVRDRRIVAFRTYLTGELFSVLSTHSILGRLFPAQGAQPTPAGDERAFADGVARAGADPAGITSLLFSVRAEGLFGRYDPGALPAYLSGLLIGAEVAHAAGDPIFADPSAPVALVGSTALVGRYRLALEQRGISVNVVQGVPAAEGLLAIARAARLLEPAQGATT